MRVLMDFERPEEGSARKEESVETLRERERGEVREVKVKVEWRKRKEKEKEKRLKK